MTRRQELAGVLHCVRVEEPIELRFEATVCPRTYRAVTVDGERLEFHRGDRLELQGRMPGEGVILADRIQP